MKVDTGESEEREQLTETEVERRLLGLADDIMNGSVVTHKQVAETIRSFVPSIGPFGGTTTEVNLAAFRVKHALLQKINSFQDNPPAPEQ